jgi:GTP-binding protein HflX
MHFLQFLCHMKQSWNSLFHCNDCTQELLCRDKMAVLRKEIEAVRAHRSSQRKRRRIARMPSVALIGYTNAGKSTLLNSLTAAGVLAEDTLFATLDPTIRRIVLPSGKLALLTDTVGFIQKLPTQLVDSFRATLEEIKVCCLQVILCTRINSQFSSIPNVHVILQCLCRTCCLSPAQCSAHYAMYVTWFSFDGSQCIQACMGM